MTSNDEKTMTTDILNLNEKVSSSDSYTGSFATGVSTFVSGANIAVGIITCGKIIPNDILEFLKRNTDNSTYFLKEKGENWTRWSTRDKCKALQLRTSLEDYLVHYHKETTDDILNEIISLIERLTFPKWFYNHGYER